MWFLFILIFIQILWFSLYRWNINRTCTNFTLKKQWRDKWSMLKICRNKHTFRFIWFHFCSSRKKNVTCVIDTHVHSWTEVNYTFVLAVQWMSFLTHEWWCKMDTMGDMLTKENMRNNVWTKLYSLNMRPYIPMSEIQAPRINIFYQLSCFVSFSSLFWFHC